MSCKYDWIRALHKNVKNTLIYTPLIEFETMDQYHVRVAKTIEEACEFVKSGFEFVTEMDGAKILRKRKQKTITIMPKPIRKGF